VAKPRGPAELLAEFLQEAAVLTAVLIPLDNIYADKPFETIPVVLITVGLALGLLIAALYVEGERR